MKRILLALSALFISICSMAQNDKGDNILGTYLNGTLEDGYKVLITKLADGTYQGMLCWTNDLYEADGTKKKDVKNPNKALRNTPMDEVILFKGLQYDPNKKQWSGAKIYDPNRGINVKMTAKFDSPDKLVVRGTVLGIGEKVTWVRID